MKEPAPFSERVLFKIMVSIIIPVYNLEKLIPETIRSVRAQSFADWELLLVDDCSTDASVQVIEAMLSETGDARIRLLRQETNQGAAAARNRGVAESKGRYVCFLDGDDLWKPEKLEHQLEFAKKHDAAFCFTGYEFADENAKPTGKIVRVPETLTYEQALQNTTIFTSTVLFDTEKIPRDEIRMPLVKSEDTALWWKILRGGRTAYGLDENLVLYRRTPGTLSSNKIEAIRRIWFLYRHEEQLPLLKSCKYFFFWAYRAVARRI